MNARNTCISSTRRRFVVTAIAGALALGFAMTSSADQSHDVRQVTVKFADLNISNPEGAAALYGRIRAAASRVCAPDQYSSFPFRSRTDDCIHKAIADAVTKVNQSALYAVYNQHNKTPLPATLLSQRH